MAKLPRVVVVFAFVSLLNDAASEMITPLLPLFLTGVLGAGAAVVGLVEGVAEATASLLKLASGWLADRGARPRRLIYGGYALSNLARPLIGACTLWPAVLALRFLDRAGKGIRTAPRDAVITAAVAQAVRGRAFGLQRALDHLGSFAGPLLATALLAAGASLQSVFLASIVPGLLVLALLSVALTEGDAPATTPRAAGPAFSWRGLDGRLRAIVVAAAALALAAAPESFLVLWARDRGVSLAMVPLLWSLTSVVKSALAYAGGRVSDRAGRLPMVMAGWTARAAVLATLALVPVAGTAAWLLFAAYGGCLAVTEGPERALVGDAAPADQRATAFGLYHLTYGLLALPGGLLFGGLWQVFGSRTAFLTAAALTVAGIVLLGALLRGYRGSGG
jgi:MFS family permease